MNFEFVPFRDLFFRKCLKRNQVLFIRARFLALSSFVAVRVHLRRFLFHTSRASSFVIPLARYPQKTHSSNYSEKRLCSTLLLFRYQLMHRVSLESPHCQDIKKPECRSNLGIPSQSCALPGLGLLSLNRLLSLLDV